MFVDSISAFDRGTAGEWAVFADGGEVAEEVGAALGVEGAGPIDRLVGRPPIVDDGAFETGEDVDVEEGFGAPVATGG